MILAVACSGVSTLAFPSTGKMTYGSISNPMPRIPKQNDTGEAMNGFDNKLARVPSGGLSWAK